MLQCSYVDTVDGDIAACRKKLPKQQFYHGRFAGTAIANDKNKFSLFNIETHVIERRCACRIRFTYMIKCNHIASTF